MCGEAVKKIIPPLRKVFFFDFQGEFSSQHTTEAKPSTPMERPKNVKGSARLCKVVELSMQC